jgi:peptidoglycan/LPS O-acetylase OafA/YrhL
MVEAAIQTGRGGERPKETAGALDFGRRIPELDGIRGVAVSLVVVYHYFIVQMSAPFHSLGACALAAGRLTWSGVDLFFVLSGFLIGGILIDARESSNYFRVFYRRRFFRIIPIYFLVLVISKVVMILIRSDLAPRLVFLSVNALPLKPFVLFLQNFWMAYTVSWGAVLLAVTWSLAVEEQFYLTLPLVVRHARGFRLIAILILGILVAPVLRWTFHALRPNDFLAWYTIMPCRADALLLGVLVAAGMRDAGFREWVKARYMLANICLCVLFVGVLVLTKYGADFFDGRNTWVITFGFTWLAAFYAVSVLYALNWRDSVLSRFLRQRWLAWLGSIAYGVYLLHFPVLYAAYGLIWSRRPEIQSVSNFGVTVLAAVATLGLCWVSWSFFEKPLVKIGHRENYRFGVRPATLSVSAVGVSGSLGENGLV